MKKSFIFLLSIFAFVSCDMKQDTSITSFVNEENIIVVSVPEPDYTNQHFFDVTQYADSVKFVRLETTDENIIGRVSNLLFSEDYIIVADRQTASIFFFDYDGNYSHKIHKRGQGGDEYISLSHVMLDRKNDIIIVHDLELGAMLYYDFQGNLTSRISQFCDRMVARDIINLPTGDFLCYRQDALGEEDKYQAGIWRAKKDGSFDQFIYTIDYDYKSTFVQYAYHLSELPDNKVSFVDQNQTAVFYVDDNNIVHKRVQFNLPGKTEADFPYESSKDEGYYSIFTSQEKGNFIFTQWITPGGKGMNTILTKSTGKLEVGVAFSPFAFGLFLPIGSFVKNNDPHICSSWFSPIVVNEFLKGDLPEDLRKKAEKTIEGIPSNEIEDANPIIQLLYIKK